MNDVAELKQFVWAHARARNVSTEQYASVLDRVTSDVNGAPGSWAREWLQAAERLEQAGDLLGASQYYNFARFPYVDGPVRAEAMSRCVSAFDRWRHSTGGIEELVVPTADGVVRCWSSGLSTTDRKPLVVFTGGVVSVKEQWAPLLPKLRTLGVAALATELPGVGQNELRYHEDSHGMFSAVLDAVADRAEVGRTYLMALSFSGHLAVRAALADSRIRGIVTVGAPVRDFFTDPAWWTALPDLTVDTLAHLTEVARPGLPEVLRGWALTAAEVSALRIPLGYVACAHDEIIPPGDPAFLTRHAQDLRLVEFPDVHGAPAHSAEMQAWSLLTLTRMLGGRPLPRALFGAVVAKQRLRRLLTHS